MCISIFRLLSETPITAFGVNYTKHFKFDNDKDYVNFGFHLAPINKTFDFLDDPRLLEITITDRKPKEKDKPVRNIKIYPSDLVARTGVGININTHYDDSKDGYGFYQFFSENWTEIIENSEKYIEEIWRRY